MRELTLLQQEIERVRQHLHELVVSKQEDFSDSEVSRLSTHLDSLILQYQQLKDRRKKEGI